MRTFQRTMAALLALLPLAVGTAFADSDHGYSRIFVFGDSLSDPGNNFAVTGATSHPPFDPLPVASYGVGGHHYLNGRTWIEYLAQEMGLTSFQPRCTESGRAGAGLEPGRLLHRGRDERNLVRPADRR
jgi:phospholipase/lecithinase/hemolysin